MAERPNILIIVADDLGFTDCGCFGGEIKTPNIDRLGYEGVRFTDFQASPACSPTRSMLMTGTSAHLAGVGCLPEFQKTFKEYAGEDSYVGHLTDRVETLPELLRDAGYYTCMAGKWHLGTTKEQSPWGRGFEKSFTLLAGGGNHYSWEPTDAKNDPEWQLFIRGSIDGLYMEDDQPVNELPKDYYSSDAFADKLIGYLKQQKDDRPFFAYLPFQAPHFPLQVDKEYIQRYHGRYDEGPEKLREERIATMKKLGIMAEDTTPSPFFAYPQRKSNRNWDKRDPVARQRAARKMECYAGMVENMDENIGKVLDHLESTGKLDNTIVYFMSDNGAEGSQLEAAPAHRNFIPGFKKYYDNSLDNLGAPNSYCWYGNRWAQVGTAPSKLYKFFSHQGGIRVCSLVRYPKWRQKAISDEYCTVMDIVPTLVEEARGKMPTKQKVLGRSWGAYMRGEAETIHDDDTVTGWEFIGRQALRKGKWKVVKLPVPWGTGQWELFDLSVDKAEECDLREQEPEKFKEMMDEWVKYKAENGIVEVPTVEVVYALQQDDATDDEPEAEF